MNDEGQAARLALSLPSCSSRLPFSFFVLFVPLRGHARMGVNAERFGDSNGEITGL